MSAPIQMFDHDTERELEDDDTFTTGHTEQTPSSQTSTGDTMTENEVPWPGSTYIILERSSNRAITLKDGQLLLDADWASARTPNNRWQCIEQNGYFGFYNAGARVYMGHDGGQNMRASAKTLDEWELVVPRHHPGGGYQLLTPYWSHSLRLVSSIENGRRLVRTQHGDTTFEFVKVENV